MGLLDFGGLVFVGVEFYKWMIEEDIFVVGFLEWEGGFLMLIIVGEGVCRCFDYSLCLNICFVKEFG